MSDEADLWHRIEAARKRLIGTDEAQIRQVQDINARIKEIRASLSGRIRELERQREEAAKLRRDNEQLRRMLHRLLLAIEQRSGGLKPCVQDLEAEVGALLPLAARLADGGARPVGAVPVGAAPAGATPAAEAAAPRPKAAVPAAAPSDRPANGVPGGPVGGPDETDSRWLHEIMERARELTRDGTAPARPVSPLQGSRTAAA